MKVQKTSKYTVHFSEDEIKDAIVFWMTRGSKNNTMTINLASLMNNSVCDLNTTEDGALSVSFDWEESEDEIG